MGCLKDAAISGIMNYCALHKYELPDKVRNTLGKEKQSIKGIMIMKNMVQFNQVEERYKVMIIAKMLNGK
jgi:hypothetical protein